MRGVKALEQYPHVIFYIIAGVTLFVAIMNFHSSQIVKDYRKTTGQICNLESKEVLKNQRYVTRYSYDAVWYSDGEEYRKHFENQVSYVEEGSITIWVHPENVDVVFYDSEEIRAEVPIYLLVSIFTYVIGNLIYRHNYNEKSMSASRLREHLEDTRLYSMFLLILDFIGIIMFAVMIYADYKNGEYIRETMIDIVIMMVVIEIVCLIKFIRAERRLKEN